MEGESINAQLFRNLRKGDIFAFEEAFRIYNRRIYAFALSFLKCREDAEGVVQEVFLSLWRKRADFQDGHNIDSYLFTITYNTVRKRFRKLSRERKYMEEYGKTLQAEAEDDSTSAAIEFENLKEVADKVISRLPDRQRRIYLLSMRDGLSTREIAIKLGISRRTVENHFHRAKDYLKKALSEQTLSSPLK